MQPDTPVQHITLDKNGIPRTVKGNVKVHIIAQRHLHAGESIQAIAEHYALSLADIHAALAYYYDNLSYFEQRERERQPLIEEARRYTDELNTTIHQRLNQQKFSSE